MRIRLIAVGRKMSDWVTRGYQEYANRLPSDCCLELCEIPLARRSKGADLAKLQTKEGGQMLANAGKNDLLVALDVRGKPWSTETLVEHLGRWRSCGNNVSLMVGGPEGLASQVSAAASVHWSLSFLTLPHPLVRIVVAEQIYRAWTILIHHPYHK